MEILMTAGQIDQLASFAKRSLPNESCAFLLGKNERVVEILPMRNSDESTVSFSIEPQEVLRAYDLAESKRLQIIGIFHSHPARAAPSSIDRRFMDINPVVWLIYSTTEQKFKAFVYERDVLEVTLKITA